MALLQHVLDMEALSAGVWYVAMDFQLYASALLVFALAQQLHAWRPAVPAVLWQQRLWLVLVAGSLWWWSGQESLDDYAVYFYGAYGLGWLACKRRAQGFSRGTWLVLLALVVVAFGLDPRWRLVTAVAVAALLAGAPAAWLDAPASQSWGLA